MKLQRGWTTRSVAVYCAAFIAAETVYLVGLVVGTGAEAEAEGVSLAGEAAGVVTADVLCFWLCVLWRMLLRRAAGEIVTVSAW